MRRHERADVRVSELFETVNEKVFKPGFEQTKELPDGKYKLVAKPGYVKIDQKQSEQFRIEVQTMRGTQLGWVNFVRNGDELEALDLNVDKQFRRRGFATEMYKFARELGNTITPSGKQTALGKAFWSKKDHSK
jgi:ribosomal protein S18 acetylase RimI-like enzyme